MGQLIRTSLRRHRTVNRLYVLMAAAMIAVLYAVLALIEDDQLLAHAIDMNDLTAVVPALLVIVLVVILLFAIVFLLYMNSILIERRTASIRVYRRLGMPVSRIGFGLLLESLLLGAAATVLGIGLGWVFSKFLAMMLLRLMGVHKAVGLLWAPRAAVELAVLFLVVYAVLGTINAIYAGNVEMTAESAANRTSRIPASGWRTLVAWAGAVVLVLSYAAAYNLVHLTYLMAQRYHGGGVWTLLAVPALGVVSLYVVFKVSLPALFVWLMKRPKLRRNAAALMTVTNVHKRLLRNVHSLFLTTLLATITITVLGSGAILYQFGQRSVTRSVALDMVASSTGVKQAFSKDTAAVIKRAVVLPTKLAAGRLSEPNHATGDGDETIYNVMALSDYTRIRRVQKGLPALTLGPHQAAMILFGRTLYQHTWLGKRQHWGLTLTRTHQRFAVKTVTGTFPLGDSAYFDRALVIPDRDFRQLLAPADPLTGYLLKQGQSGQAAKQLNDGVGEDYVGGSAAILTGKKAPRVKATAGAADFGRRAVQFKAPLMGEMNVLFGMGLFIVILLGAVFIVATASILMIKQLMLAAEDHQARTILRQLGMPQPLEQRVAAAQTAVIFALPLAFGTLNSALMIRYLSMFLNDPGVFLVIVIVAVYILVYLAFGILTVRLTART
ncbi:FtsX-like permease family protein [Lacticaseibacillus sp. 866-1]|uniref:FtsX-like permease family protein n=1 Tax=Lacticaseibacillus sp. 866-1 TaxID=2799576 RepID=UPI0019405034|nr:FtsX-like permease family protein [Lacticaseibacillus sp. 866-1]